MSAALPNRKWMWVFLVFFVLAIVGMAIPWWFNHQQQLTPEKLADARKLWAEHGPSDYDFVYQKRIDASEKIDTVHVQVRGGKVKSATINVKPEEVEKIERENETALAEGRPVKPLLKEPPNRLRFYGMPRMFEEIEDFLDQDAKPGGPRVFAVAHFDPHDGHLRYYVRSVQATQQRLEIKVTEFKELAK